MNFYTFLSYLFAWYIIYLPHFDSRLKSLMIALPLAVMLRIDPSSKLNVTLDMSSLTFDLAISPPSSRTVTSPALLQFPNSNVADPTPQNDVEIHAVDHCWSIHLKLSKVCKRFSQALWVNTKRVSALMAVRSQPCSFMASWELKSDNPSFAQSADGPWKRKKEIKKIIRHKIFGSNSSDNDKLWFDHLNL